MIFSLDGTSPDSPFPNPELAESDPDGLLAVGGDLSPQRLLNAYRGGIFPWFSDDQPILWWSPDPRTILIPDQIHISRSLRKVLRKNLFRVSFDTAFDEVISACASIPREQQDGTWILPEMIAAYRELHRLGFAHSVEVWLSEKLVGGLYGVSVGKAFYGESMFHTETNASKIALAALANRLDGLGFHFIDCQMMTAHLIGLGAQMVTRDEFLQQNRLASGTPVEIEWRLEPELTAKLSDNFTAKDRPEAEDGENTRRRIDE